MQTFLPYSDFTKSARVLDTKRLGKQRVECLQILRTLSGESQGWRNHPAVRMWYGYEWELYWYSGCIIDEWIRRGYKDRCLTKINSVRCAHSQDWQYHKPPWLGNRRFHESHRSNLLRKKPEHYRQFWPRLSAELPYVWPKGRNDK